MALMIDGLFDTQAPKARPFTTLAVAGREDLRYSVDRDQFGSVRGPRPCVVVVGRDICRPVRTMTIRASDDCHRRDRAVWPEASRLHVKW